MRQDGRRGREIKEEEYGSGKEVQKMERYKEREVSVSQKQHMKQGVKQQN